MPGVPAATSMKGQSINRDVRFRLRVSSVRPLRGRYCPPRSHRSQIFAVRPGFFSVGVLDDFTTMLYPCALPWAWTAARRDALVNVSFSKGTSS